MYIAGINPTFSQSSAEVTAQGLKYGPGQLGYNSTSEGPKGYIWAKANAAITGDSYVCILTVSASGWTADMITTTLAAAGTGQGKLVGVCRSDVALATNGWGWFQIFGVGNVRVSAAVAAYTNILATATAGQLDDGGTGPVSGIVLTTAAAAAGVSPAIINHPRVG